VVGDMALFMTANGLSEQDVMEQGNQLAFPDSVVSFFKGDLGQPHGGFPEALQKMVLKGAKPYSDRPNAHLDPIDFEKEMKEFRSEFGEKLTDLDFISYKLYPKVYKDYLEHRNTYGTVYRIPTLAYLYGLKPGEDIQIPLAIGKTLSIKYLYKTEPDEKGYRRVSFDLNGQSRIIKIKDESLEVEIISNRKAVEKNEIGAPLQGRLSKILVKEGDKVNTNDVLFVREAMKMESSVVATGPGTIKAIHLSEGALVEQDDLVVEMD